MEVTIDENLPAEKRTSYLEASTGTCQHLPLGTSRMPSGSQPLRILGLALMLLGARTTFGDDLINIRVYNDTAEKIVVTVYDMNAQPPGAVLASQRINGFAWIPVSVTAGAVGNGHIMWTARTAGASFHRCGHQEMRGLANDDSVRVFADSKCVRIVR